MSRYDGIAEWYEEVSEPWASSGSDGSGAGLTPYFSPDGLACRVGARHVPLAELLNGLLAARLRLERVEEFGGDRDQGHVPRDLALVATKSPV